MTRITRFILRVALALASAVVGIIIAIARIALGHECYTALVVTASLCWALLPDRGECVELDTAMHDQRRDDAAS